MQGRVLAIDFGLRRMGLAVSDPLGLTAQGLPTIERTHLAAVIPEILKLLGEYEVREVIVGNPLNRDGTESTMSRRAARFAAKLGRRAQRAVKLWDERLTSAEANRMLRSSGIGLMKRRRAVDRVSAVLILQSYLDSQSGRGA